MKKGVVFFLLLLCGCASFKEFKVEKSGNPVRLDTSNFRADFVKGRFFISGSLVRLSDIVRVLVSRGLRVACSDKLLAKSSSVDFDGDFTVLEIMRKLEVSYNCTAEKNGDLWVLNDLAESKDESKLKMAGTLNNVNGDSSVVSRGGYVYYFRMGGFSSQEVISALGEYGVKRLGNALYYCRSDIARIMELDTVIYNMFANMPVQYYFVVWLVSDDFLRDVGAVMTPSVRGSAGRTFSRSSSVPFDYSVVLDAVLDSSFDLARKKGVRRMGGVVREGGEFVFRIGDDVPMAKRSVSDSGTVTDTGYEYQRFGFSVRVRVEGRSFGVCNVELENTDIGGYVGGYPIKHGSNLTTVLQIGDDRRFYVGSCLMDSKSWGFLSFRRQRQEYHVLLQCDLLEAGQRVESSLDVE